MPRRSHQFFFPGAPQAVYWPPIGIITPGQSVGLPTLPAGYRFVVDTYGNYFVNSSGAYYITARGA